MRKAPETTTRDAEALAWIGEQWCVRYDTLAVLLGRLGKTQAPLSLRSVYGVVQRWADRGFVTQERAVGARWIVPTRKGLQVADKPWPRKELAVRSLRHVHYIAQTRLAWERDHPDEPWISNREIMAARGQRIPDGSAIHETDDGDVLIWFEVELTIQKPRVMVEKFRKGVPEDLAVIYWHTLPKQVERMRRVLEKAVPASLGYQISVGAIPEVDGIGEIRW